TLTSIQPSFSTHGGLDTTAVGGAAEDAQARFIGIATPRFGRFGVVAIPATLVDRVIDTLLQKGRIPRGYLGVGLQAVRLPDALRESLQRTEKTAAIVLEVEPEGPAHKAGIVIGDIFVALENQPVSCVEYVQTHLQGDAMGKRHCAQGICRG